jgi:hypothetical protein
VNQSSYRYAVVSLLGLMAAFLSGFDVPAPAPMALPFQAGEELTFELRWLGVSVGVATLSVGPLSRVDDHDVLPLLSLARSHSFFSTFYEVDDRVESHFDPRRLLPRAYRIRLQEGSYRVHREVLFDPEQQRATYSKNHQPARLVPTGEAAQDPLSSLYVVRTLPLKVGESVYLPIFDRGKTWMTEIQVLARERLQLPVGTINTLKVKPLLRTGGIFRREGDLLIWLSDDAQRVPVQMQARITIGSVSARLVQVKGVELTDATAGNERSR